MVHLLQSEETHLAVFLDLEDSLAVDCHGVGHDANGTADWWFGFLEVDGEGREGAEEQFWHFGGLDEGFGLHCAASVGFFSF